MNAEYRKNFAAINWHPMPAPQRQYQPVARGDFPTPQVMRDGMDAVQSQTDGKMYDSKAALRREYKRANVVEVGNEVQRHDNTPRASKDTGDIDRALNAVGL